MLVLCLILGAAVVLTLSRRVDANAAPDDTAALRRAGALLWKMSEVHHDFSNRRIARKVTPDKVRKLAVSTATSHAKNRAALAKLLPALKPDTRFAGDVTHFLQRWPDRDAFYNDLMSESGGSASGAAITSLAMQVTDTRRRWKTLFPLFRP